MAFTDADLGELANEARAIIDVNRYCTLSTADVEGRPWATPVYFTPEPHGALLWVSSPTARHSLNVAARPEVGVVIFDSTVPIGQGRAVYLDARVELVPDADIDATTDVFTARYEELGSLTVDDLRSPGPLRLYRAVPLQASVLVRGSDPRNDSGIDMRVDVDL